MFCDVGEETRMASVARGPVSVDPWLYQRSGWCWHLILRGSLATTAPSLAPN